MAMKKKLRSAALQYTYDKFVGDDAEQNASYEHELLNIEIAKRLYDLRTKAGLSQRELARKVGTTASAICRLEDADYEGHSLSMLRRIAAALDKRIEIRFVEVRKEAAHLTGARSARRKRKEVLQGTAHCSSVKLDERKPKRARQGALRRTAHRTGVKTAQQKRKRVRKAALRRLS
ncbi:MAG: helix-turn-helix transcriptional regulator [Bryobacteraceae bacterium]